MILEMHKGSFLLCFLISILGINPDDVGTDQVVLKALYSMAYIEVIAIPHLWQFFKDLGASGDKEVVLSHRASNGSEDADSLEDYFVLC
jgi:hypothetical protein